MMSFIIIGAISTGMMVHLQDSLNEKNAIAGVVLLRTKLQAMNQSTSETWGVSNGRLNDQYAVPFNNCTLRFTRHGTASKSGTCYGPSKHIALRPGEGGIGYPWD